MTDILQKYTAKTSPSGIYSIRNRINGKIYIGSSVNVVNRVKCHLKGKGSRAVANAILKYDLRNFECSILEEVSDRTKLAEAEAIWMERLKPEYNLITETESGGRIISSESKKLMAQAKAGGKLSEEHKAKIGAAGKGKRHTEETKRLLSERKKGTIVWPKGKPRSEENKAKISAARKGKPLSEEHRRKLSESHKGQGKGIPLSEEHKRKISEAQIGKKMSESAVENMRKALTGRKLSDTHKAAIGAGNRGKVHRGRKPR